MSCFTAVISVFPWVGNLVQGWLTWLITPGRFLHPAPPRAVPSALCSAALLPWELGSLSPLVFPGGRGHGVGVGAGRAGTARALAVRSGCQPAHPLFGGCTHLAEGSQQPHGSSPSGHCCGKGVEPCECCKCPPGRGSSCICGLCSYIRAANTLFSFYTLRSSCDLFPLDLFGSFSPWEGSRMGVFQPMNVLLHTSLFAFPFIWWMYPVCSWMSGVISGWGSAALCCEHTSVSSSDKNVDLSGLIFSQRKWN